MGGYAYHDFFADKRSYVFRRKTGLPEMNPVGLYRHCHVHPAVYEKSGVKFGRKLPEPQRETEKFFGRKVFFTEAHSLYSAFKSAVYLVNKFFNASREMPVGYEIKRKSGFHGRFQRDFLKIKTRVVPIKTRLIICAALRLPNMR